MEFDPILQELHSDNLSNCVKDELCQNSEALTDQVFTLPEFHLDNLDSLTLSPDVMALANQVLPPTIASSNAQQTSSTDFVDPVILHNSMKLSTEETNDYFPLDSLHAELDLDEYSLLREKVACNELEDLHEKNFDWDEHESLSRKLEVDPLTLESNEIESKAKKRKLQAKKKKTGAGVMAVLAISRNKASNITQIVINTGNKEDVYEGKTLELIPAKKNMPKLSKADSCQSSRHEMIITRALEDLGITEENLQCSEHGKVWLCPREDCAKRFTKLYALKGHLLGHFGIRPFKCDHEGCTWAFYSEFKLKRHKETHLKRKDYACKIPGCKRKFTTIYNLWSHEKLHSRPSRITCQVPECQEKFQTKRSLEVHMKSHDQSHAPYVCSHEGCEKRYYSSNALTSHQRCHSYKESDIKCSWPGCDKVFDKPCRLKAHMRSHTGCKPYLCTFQDCQWAFTSSSKLKRHQKKHTNERKFVCEISSCGKAFMRSEHLKEHRLTHEEGRCFQCHLCDAKFSAKSSLYVHIKKHHRDNPEKETSSEGTSVVNVQASSFPPADRKISEYLDNFCASSSLSSYDVSLSRCKSSFSDDDGIELNVESDIFIKSPVWKAREEKIQGCARTCLTRWDVAKLKAGDSAMVSDSLVTDVILDSSDDIADGLFLTEDLPSSLYYQDDIEGVERQVLLLGPSENVMSLRHLE